MMNATIRARSTGGRRLARGWLALLAAVALALTGCQGSEKPQGEQPAASDAGEKPVWKDGKLQPLSDGFPDSPITLWSSFTVGHGDDILNRTVAEAASRLTTVRVTTDVYEAGPQMSYGLVSNFLPGRPRAGEGYNIYMANWLAMAVRPFSTDSVAQFEPDYLVPVVGIMYRGFVYVVPPDSQFASVADVVDAAKQRPGEMRFCAGTATSTVTLSGYAFLKEAGVDMTFIPSEGSAEAKTLMLGGGCDFMVATYVPGMENDLKLLAVSDAERNPVLPDVPTIAEEGFTALGGNLSGYGVLPDVPQSHRDWISALMLEVIKDDKFIEANQGALIQGYTVEEIQQLMEADIDAYYPVLVDLGMNVRER